MTLSEEEISEEIEIQKNNFSEMKRLGLIKDFKMDEKIKFDDIGKNPYLDIHVQLNIPIKKLTINIDNLSYMTNKTEK